MLLELQDSQLVLVDYQSQLMPVMHEGAAVLRNGVRLAQMAHLLKVPTWGTEQNPERLGHNPVEISEVCRRTLAKMSFGACEEGLGEVLPRRPVRLQAMPAVCRAICKRPSQPLFATVW